LCPPNSAIKIESASFHFHHFWDTTQRSGRSPAGSIVTYCVPRILSIVTYCVPRINLVLFPPLLRHRTVTRAINSYVLCPPNSAYCVPRILSAGFAGAISSPLFPHWRLPRGRRSGRARAGAGSPSETVRAPRVHILADSKGVVQQACGHAFFYLLWHYQQAQMRWTCPFAFNRGVRTHPRMSANFIEGGGRRGMADLTDRRGRTGCGEGSVGGVAGVGCVGSVVWCGEEGIAGWLGERSDRGVLLRGILCVAVLHIADFRNCESAKPAPPELFSAHWRFLCERRGIGLQGCSGHLAHQCGTKS